MVDVVQPYETGDSGNPGPNRWSGGKERDGVWRAMRPQLVAETAIDHVSDGRIRHGAKFLRWRDDKSPQECTVDQLET